MLQLRDVTKAYGRKCLLDGVTAAFPVGLTLLTGPAVRAIHAAAPDRPERSGAI